MSDTLLTIKEAAKYLNLHWQTIRKYIKEGKIEASKIGRNIRIKKSELNKLLEDQNQKEDKVEIEIRYKIHNRNQIEKNLLDLNAQLVYHGHIIDHWYVPNHIKTLEQKNEYYSSGKGYGLRIREQDNGYTGKITTSLEVKRLAIPNKHDTCIEQEIAVTSYEQANQLVKHINHKEIIVIDKDRVVYNLDGFKIVIDDIKDFAVGVEIEKVTSEDRKQIIKEIKNLADKIGVTSNAKFIDKSLTYQAMEKLAKF